MNLATRWGAAVGAAVTLWTAAAGAKPAGAPVGKEAVRQAILIFQRDPAGAQGSMARPLILNFAQDSADCQVDVSPKLLPWLDDKALPTDDAPILVTAYCAGEIDSQLHGGNPHDAALVAACEQVIATYRQLQKKTPGLRVPGVEKLISLQREHRLRKYLQEADRELSPGEKKPFQQDGTGQAG